MGPLASLLVSFVTGEAGTIAKQVRSAAIAYGLALLGALVGIFFLVLAAYLWAARRFGSIEAALGFGIGFVVLAGVILTSYRFMEKKRARRRARRRKSDFSALAIAAGVAALPELLRSKRGLGALLGPLAALFAFAVYRENFPSKPNDPAGGVGDSKPD